jgi:carboxypeptidase family protein/TonB-dependent receptor-like protein
MIPIERATRFAVWLSVQLLVFVISIQAQVGNGSIAGQVTDSTHASVPNATVRLTNNGTAVTREVQSDSSGIYSFPIVPPGLYTIRAELTGFQTVEVTNLEVQVAQQIKRDFELVLGKTATSLEVKATAPVLEQRSAEIGQVISPKEVVELPLNGRNYFDLARLTPGVTELAGSSQSTGLAINGQRANQISFFFDGVDTRTETSGRPAFTPSIEAIQEFKVQENNFAAEYGRNPSAINLSLKPGANDYHGSLFEFLRNNALDARSFFSQRVDPLRRNQFGGVISGPIKRNKTFFMGNYEGLRTRRASTLYLTVPSEAQRAGNFSGGATIYDPATYSSSTGKRQAFAGNVIPTSRFGQIALGALQYYPQPNTSGGAFNYITRVSTVADSDQGHGRIDHTFSDTDSIFGRYSYSTSPNLSPGGLPYTGSNEYTKASSVTVQEIHIFTPTQVNQFRVAWTFFDDNLTFPTLDQNVTRTQFGLLNLDPPSTANGVPQTIVPGLTIIGANPFQPGGQRENIYSLADDFSWTRGKHNWKFGFDGRYYRPASRVQQTPNGIITFANQFTNQPGVAGTGNAIADFLLGTPNNIRATQLAESNGLVSLKYYYYGFYGQDEIRLRPNLVMNIGLRYEYQTPYKERYGDLASLDLANTRMIKQDDGIGTLNRPDRNNFAPRLGIAYTLTPKTVIRTGAGVFFGSPRGSEFGSFQLSPPFVIDTTLNSSALVPDLIGRAFPVPVVRTPSGQIALSSNTNVFVLDQNFRTNYTYEWNFSIQRELAANWLLETAYVGNSAHKLTSRDLPNQAYLDVDPTRPTSITSRRPNPNIGDVSLVQSLDNSNYHSLTVKLNKRYSNGLSIIGGYTYSKAMGIGGALFGDQSRTQDERNRAAEYAPLEFNQKHRVTLAWVYELPFGRAKLVGGNLHGPAGALVSGWSFQGNFTTHSGFPLTPVSSVSSNVGRQDMNRADRSCDGNLPSDQQSVNGWFQTSCFANHAFGRFGTSGNGVIVGPGLTTVDLAALKNTAIRLPGREPGNLQFRAEFFNAFNHAAFNDPNMTAGTAQFGLIRSTRVNGREIQLALKFLF